MAPHSYGQLFEAYARPSSGAGRWPGPGAPSVFWSSPHGGVRAVGLGRAGEGFGEVRWLGGPGEAAPGPWFGGWAFDARRPWAGFPDEQWVLPEVLVWWAGGRQWEAAFGPAGVGAGALVARLNALEWGAAGPSAEGVALLPSDRAAWSRLVGVALGRIGVGELQKVVCARPVDVVARRPWDVRRVLEGLEVTHPECWTFLVSGAGGQAFVGATPEVLCEVSSGRLTVDALAGTAAPGDGEALLRSEKNRREHLAVVEMIGRTLEPFARDLTWPPAPGLKRLANVVHLHTLFEGALREGVDALEVARALHPTPAVAGTPRDAAMDFLAEAEGFARGWYAGAVGARGPGGLTLTVALRSTLLEGARARVFVGAGIVEGSDADDEWLETERKAAALWPALGVSEVDVRRRAGV